MKSKLIKIFENNVEYQLLPYQFFLLTLWGVWCPKSWSSKVKKLHNIFFTIVFFLDFLLCTEMLIYFISSVGTSNFKLINLFFVSANITGVCKSIKLKQNRKSIRSLIISYFNYQWLNLRDSREYEINEKINSKIKNVTITYSASMLLIVLLKAMSPLAEPSTVPLPVDAWYPYSVEKSAWFWITYFHQVILGSSAVSSHIGADTLFVGLLLKTLCQINILEYRLKNFTKICQKRSKNDRSENINMERKMLIQCIHHHQRIYRFGNDLNHKFQAILIILVVASLPNICINVYSLSAYTDEINVQYIATFFSTTSALIQFFITCWYGNEITLNIIKSSYTAFNLLQQTTK